MAAQSNTKHPWRLDRLVYLPILASIVIVAILLIRTAIIQRETVFERTKIQLDMMISTLADFNEFAERTANSSSASNEAQREAIWNALLHYPAAKIWIESSDGKVIS